MKQEPDYYAALQVDPRAEPEVIEAAYRRLAAKYHPDVDSSPEASERMKLLNAAHEVLSDPEKRKAYALRRAGPRQQERRAPGASRRRLPWWLLLVAAAMMAVAFRLSPKLLLMLGSLFLVLWVVWSWRTHDSGE